MSVIFDQLRISDDGKQMYINLHVNKAKYFNDIYIDSLTIMTSDKVSEINPNEPTEDYIYKKVFEGNQKTADLVLTAEDFIRTWEDTPEAMRFRQSDMLNTLFFVFVKCKGTPSECIPCRLDEEITLGVTFDVNMLYQIVMQQTRQLVDKCDIPRDFLDLILLWNGFKAAIETEHYVVAIDFWKKIFHSKNSAVSLIRGCRCHG